MEKWLVEHHKHPVSIRNSNPSFSCVRRAHQAQSLQFTIRAGFESNSSRQMSGRLFLENSLSARVTLGSEKSQEAANMHICTLEDVWEDRSVQFEKGKWERVIMLTESRNDWDERDYLQTVPSNIHITLTVIRHWKKLVNKIRNSGWKELLEMNYECFTAKYTGESDWQKALDW